MVSHYLLCACSEEHVMPNSYNFLLMNATIRYISPGELLFSLEIAAVPVAIVFYRLHFQLTVEKRLAITKSRIS